MSPRRLDPGEWGIGPYPRLPCAPWWVVLRHGAEIEFAAMFLALTASVGVSSDSPLRLLVLALVLSTFLLSEVRLMVLGQWRRIVLTRRLQTAFLEMAVRSPERGLTPTVIGSAAIPGGTVIRLWVPIGLSIDDLDEKREALAEACLVDTVEVRRRPGRWNTVEMVLVHRTLGRQRESGTI